MPRPAQQQAGSHGQARLPRVLLLVAMLAGCALDAGFARSLDAAGTNAPADQARVRAGWEPIGSGEANDVHDVLGRSHAPVTRHAPFTQRGLASWYGRRFHGKRTASGEIYDMYAMTAAHPTLPIPSYARVRNPANGREVVVRINDRGPFHSKRIIDLSYAAALKLDLLRGVGLVELQRIPFPDLRSARDTPASGAVLLPL